MVSSADRDAATSAVVTAEEFGDTARAENGSIVIDTLRALLRIRSAQGAAELLQRAVHHFGGSVTAVDDAGPDALPIDLSLGEGVPMLAVAAPFSPARKAIERSLPRLVEDARQAVDLLRRNERLEADSNRDPLTGLANRRVLDRILPRAEQGVVIMADLDHFKRINDETGHAAGDAVLAAFGRLLIEEVRANDISCRIGGEEFVIVSPHMSVPDAIVLVDRMRASWLAMAPQPVTFSAGVAEVGPSGGTAALLAADHALYRAKGLGRNRTEVAADLSHRAESANAVDVAPVEHS